MTAPSPHSRSSTPALPIRMAIALIAPADADIRSGVSQLEALGQPVRWYDVTNGGSGRIAQMRATLLHVMRSPGTVRAILGAALRNLSDAFATIAIAPRALQIASELRTSGIRHVHADGSATAVTLGTVVALVTDSTFSCSAPTAPKRRRAAKAPAFVVPPGPAALHQELERHRVTLVAARSDFEAVDWRVLDARSLAIRWMSCRNDSTIAEVAVIRSSPPPRRVILKQHRHEADASRSPQVRARYEYDMLRILRESIRQSADGTFGAITYSVPEPLLLDESSGTLVVERAGGTPLDELIRIAKKSRRAATVLDEPVRRAGRWLRLMQSATRAATDSEPILEQLVDDAIRNATTAATHDPKLAPRIARIATRLREMRADVATRRLPLVGHHGDYWPGNIFIDEQRVEVIDFEGYRLGFEMEDVAYFLVELDLLFPRSRDALPSLRRGFFEAYAGGAPSDAAPLDLFTMTKTLHLLARSPGANQPLPIRLWIRKRLRQIVMGLIK